MSSCIEKRQDRQHIQNTWKTSELIESLFDFMLFLLGLWKFYKIIQFTSDSESYSTNNPRNGFETVDLSAPAVVSPVTCKKLPVAKNLNVINTWLVAEVGKLRLVDGLISSSTSRTMYEIVSLPKQYRARNSLSES